MGNLIRRFAPPSGAAARPALKMIHWIIFRALRPPCEGKTESGFPQTPFRERRKEKSINTEIRYSYISRIPVLYDEIKLYSALCTHITILSIH